MLLKPTATTPDFLTLKKTDMQQGKIIFFNTKSKFGFLKDDVSGDDYYFSVKKPTEELTKDDRVSFEIRPSKRGPEAYNVKKITS